MSTAGRFVVAVGIAAAVVAGAYFALRREDPRPSDRVALAPVVPPPTSSGASAKPPPDPTDVAPTPRVDATPSAAVVDTQGWHARGTVSRSIGGAAVAGARVALALKRGDGTSTPLARLSSAADGGFLAALPPLADLDADARAVARLEVRCEATGFQPFQASLPLAGAAPRALAIEARLVEGAAVRGRVVDGEGRPVANATAAISLADGRSGPGGLTLVSEAESDGEGRFALGFTAKAKLFLTVRADGVGVDAQQFDVEARRDHDVGDVVLSGGPPLGGILRYADGQPAPQVELWALEGETSFKPDAFELAVRRAREVERDDGGLSWSRTFTDAAGRFEFRGLRLDHFALKAADPAIVIEPRQGRWEPGQSTVVLEVQTPLLVVRVVDSEGRPALGALVEATDLGQESDGSYTSGEARRSVARGATASTTFSADPETPLAIRARLRGHVSPEEIVYFGQGTQHLEHTLVLAPRTKSGTLRFTVAGADPTKLTMRLALASPVTGQRDEEVGVLDVDASGVVSGIPPGEHLLVADFGGEEGAWLFPWRSPAPVRVAAEGETRVTIEPALGARLAIACEMVGPPPPGYDDPATPSVRRETHGARFVLVPVDGGRETTLDLRLGEHDVYLLLPGETGEARDLLPAGDFVIRVEGTRWMSTQTRIRLSGGRKLSARVELRGR